MADQSVNSLITTKPSETTLTVSLHPLVLLTASDLITRHRVREEEGPLAGILLGQQTGRETTAEQAFPARLIKVGENWILDQQWTADRIQQFKDVHKAPALDIVGWFTTCPESGPLLEHATIQQQITTQFNENSIFLTIHPADLTLSKTTNRRLPITIYECITEGEIVQDEANMQIDGEENANVKFRQLPYTVDTDETEMIAVDYVAKGAGSAAAVDGVAKSSTQQTTTDVKGKQKAGAKPSEQQISEVEKSDELTTEEEDHIAGITTRLNSVKMLQSRLHLLTAFVRSLPPSYLTDPDIPLSKTSPSPEHLPHLRNVQALLARLSLLTPSQNSQQPISAYEKASQSQKNDVALASMLSQLGQDVQGLSELGRKFATVEQGKSTKSKNKGGFNQGSFGGNDDHNGQIGGLTLNSGMLV